MYKKIPNIYIFFISLQFGIYPHVREEHIHIHSSLVLSTGDDDS